MGAVMGDLPVGKDVLLFFLPALNLIDAAARIFIQRNIEFFNQLGILRFNSESLSRSASMSYKAISASRNAGVLMLSPITLRTNTVLPAPINVILIIYTPKSFYAYMLKCFRRES